MRWHVAITIQSPVNTQMQRPDILATTIKSLEKKAESILIANQPWIVRLDGASFKTFTSSLQKPFDPALTSTFALTAAALLRKFNAVTAFTQSDEITLVFPPENDLKQMLYAGRISKITSIISSFATAAFNDYWYNLTNKAVFIEKDKDKENDSCSLTRLGLADDSGFIQFPDYLLKRVALHPCFDARAFTVPDKKTAIEALLWRHVYDCRRNAFNSIGTYKYGSSNMHGLSLKELTDKLDQDKALDNVHVENIRGLFLKKILYETVGVDPRDPAKTPIQVTRNRVEGRVLDWNDAVDDEESMKEKISLVFNKFWNE